MMLLNCLKVYLFFCKLEEWSGGYMLVVAGFGRLKQEGCGPRATAQDHVPVKTEGMYQLFVTALPISPVL